MAKDKRLVKPRKGHSPDILRKGGAHRDRKKEDRNSFDRLLREYMEDVCDTTDEQE
jgi:hypothetical protein